jgi:DUF4097 and DUF4098 domain-containing protein YvlB
MKKLFVLSVSVLLSATFTAYGQNNEPFATHTFSTSLIKSVESATTNGEITVNGNATSEAIVEVFVSPINSGNSRSARRNKLSDEEIKRIIEKEYTIDVKVEGEKLYAIARTENRGQQKINISFNISVPKQDANCNLQTVNGGVSINNLSGSQSLSTVNGSLKVENVSGNITGTTTNGNINTTNSNGKITLATINGNINIADVSGVISTRTTNGKVTERNVSRK